MLKKGFTLAEVLITLAIIGVVAALTAPALMSNVGNSKVGPTLAKFVNTFEAAAESAMTAESVSDLDSLGEKTFTEGGLEILSKYMIMAPIEDTIKVTNAAGTKNAVTAKNCWQLKDGTIIIPSEISVIASGQNSGWKDKGSYKGPTATILVDIGGTKSLHRAGKEVFAFVIDSSGSLVPFGSNTFKWLTGIDQPCHLTSEEIRDNLACTGKIADNKWKANF